MPLQLLKSWRFHKYVQPTIWNENHCKVWKYNSLRISPENSLQSIINSQCIWPTQVLRYNHCSCWWISVHPWSFDSWAVSEPVCPKQIPNETQQASNWVSVQKKQKITHALHTCGCAFQVNCIDWSYRARHHSVYSIIPPGYSRALSINYSIFNATSFNGSIYIYMLQ